MKVQPLYRRLSFDPRRGYGVDAAMLEVLGATGFGRMVGGRYRSAYLRHLERLRDRLEARLAEAR